MSERVYMVWDIYDGIRSGIADYDGNPHYFECLFDDQIDEYSELFELKPIDPETLGLAQQQWAIYQSWETKYHSGIEQLKNHPGHAGVNPRYDELEKIVKSRIKVTSTTAKVRAVFNRKEDQPPLPHGCLLEMEVDWY